MAQKTSEEQPNKRTYRARSGLFHLLADLSNDENKLAAWNASNEHRRDIMQDYGLSAEQQRTLEDGWNNGNDRDYLDALRRETMERFDVNRFC